MPPHFLPMPITFVQGNPLDSSAPVLAFATNANGSAEVSPLATTLINRYPAAFATFHRFCRDGRIQPGTYWIWRESRPHLMFMVVRQSAAGATRLRYVEAVAMTLARDYRFDLIEALAMAPLCDALQWNTVKPALLHWLHRSALPVTVYEP